VELSQSKLKRLLTYNPDSGLFTRNFSRGSGKKGTVSGHVNKYGYVQVIIDRKVFRAHRLACLYMTGKFPVDQMDHINHIRDDNRWINLRQADSKENCKNMSLSKRNKSGTCGVNWSEPRKRWCSSIRVNRKLIYLGRFTDIDSAIKSRKKAEALYGFHANHGKKLIRGNHHR